MPNWCQNFATFICPTKTKYDELLESITNDTWFQTFASLGLDKNEYEDGYERTTAIAVWNTKWPPQEVEIVSTSDDTFTIEVSFDTAWSPPTGVYCKMKSDFDIDTTAFYEELGCQFFGRCIFSKEQELNETYDIPSNKTELIDLRAVIGSELNNHMESTFEELEQQWLDEEEEEEEEEEEVEVVKVDNEEEQDEAEQDEADEIIILQQ